MRSLFEIAINISHNYIRKLNYYLSMLLIGKLICFNNIASELTFLLILLYLILYLKLFFSQL